VTLTRSGAQGQPAAYSFTTAADGAFVITGVAPGNYLLAAERNGYLRAEHGQRGPNSCGAPIAIGTGQQLTGLQISMVPAGAIYGRVYEQDGEGAPNVVVQTLRYTYAGGQRQLAAVQTVQTNDLGEYRLFWLSPGRYYIGAATDAASASSSVRIINTTVKDLNTLRATGSSPTLEERYVASYFPGVPDPGAAAAIDLRPGENIGGVNVPIRLGRTSRIRGTVVNAETGQPSNASVWLAPQNPIVRARTPLNGTRSAWESSSPSADTMRECTRFRAFLQAPIS